MAVGDMRARGRASALAGNPLLTPNVKVRNIAVIQMAMPASPLAPSV